MRALNLVILTTTLILFPGCTERLPNDTGISVTAENPGEQIIITEQPGEALIDIYSPSGIGGAAVEFPENNIPDLVTIRLYLKGLEEFLFDYDNTHITASVSSQDSDLVLQTVRKDDPQASDAQSITPTSSYWLDITIVSDYPSGEINIPLEDGYFQVSAPQDFLDGDYPRFELHWIDFYR